MLHALVPPSKNAKSKTKEIWKFSIIDSQTSFLIFCKTQLELTERIAQMIGKNKKFGLSTNLYMSMVGNSMSESQIQVTFDEITYTFDDLLHAMDCAFKVIMVFRLSYQPQAINFWQLLQGCFSDIPLDGQVPIAVREHINQIKKNIYDLE